jgi:hypothetical protein
MLKTSNNLLLRKCYNDYMSRPRQSILPKSQEDVIGTQLLLKEVHQNLSLLNTLSVKDELNLIEKTVFIRAFSKLGEYLTFFRNPEVSLTPIQQLIDTQSNYPVVTSFIYYRNKLLHDYFVQQIRGDEKYYEEAKSFFKNNVNAFSNALAQIESQPKESMPSILKKTRNKPPGMYDLCEMTKELETFQITPEKAKLYIKLGKDSLTYIAFGMTELGVITNDELKAESPLALNKLHSIKSDILKITSERGHTTPLEPPNPLNHCFYANRAIEKFNSILLLFDIRLNNENDINSFFKDSRFPKAIVQNFLESSVLEITTHLKNYNRDWSAAGIGTIAKSDILRHPEVFLGKAEELLNAIDRIRNDAAHQRKNLNAKTIINVIDKLASLSIYLTQMEEVLKNRYEKNCDPLIKNFYKENLPDKTHPDTEVNTVSDVKDEKHATHAKRSSQDFTTSNSPIPKKLKSDETPPDPDNSLSVSDTSNQTSVSSSIRDNKWKNFEDGHPDVTRSIISTPPLAPQTTHSLPSSSPLENPDNEEPDNTKRKSP